MYHCHIHFYLPGRKCREFEIVREMAPLAHFTHSCQTSDRPEDAYTAEADVIIANLKDTDAQLFVSEIVLAKREDAQLILLADQSQVSLVSDYFPKIHDIWIAPMTADEFKFRLIRWQQNYKMEKDFWQTSHFFETTINHVPNLVWYKDKNGIHTKVNDSFCRTVNKTKEQVQGRGHAYIWDVEHDDPACIESEREVMESEKTCVSEEVIQTGAGDRILTTYKSPLYDLDGSVMGTVGVAIDVTDRKSTRLNSSHIH